MGHLIGTAAILAALVPVAASAASISYDVPVIRSGPTPNTDISVTLPGFDTSLGTLTGETLLFEGYFTPGIEWMDATQFVNEGTMVPSFQTTLTPRFKAGGVTYATLATQTVTANLQGSPVLTGNIWNANYVAYGNEMPFSTSYIVPEPPAQEQWTVWAGSGPGPGIPYDFDGTAELGDLSADLIVTYDYKHGHGRRLPEPATLPLLAMGLLGLCGAALMRH